MGIGSLFMVAVFVGMFPVMGLAQDVTCPDDSLQDAIDAASAGDTITVSGTCAENVLIPLGKDELVLDGGGTATINGPNTTTNATVMVRARGVTIKGFTITGGYDGIWVVFGGNARIEENTVQGAARNGISVGAGSSAQIINNTVQSNVSDGIAVNESSAARIGVLSTFDTETKPNTIQNNGESGILVTRSSSALIVGNTISNNTLDGVKVVRASHADIANNTIDDNKENGIFVSMNSGANLGNDSGDTIYDLVNTTTAGHKNLKYAIKCATGGYADGRRGSLKGVKGVVSLGGGGIDSTIP
jgi:parallel beta-helix repeat protein